MTEPRLLDTAGLASLLGVSTRTLARMVKNGHIPQPLAIGRLRRWNPLVIDEALRLKSKETQR